MVATEVDTDQLGTFSGERARTGSALETAIAKARLGMNQTGHALGIASEGSIGPDPQNPFLISDIEIVVLVDMERNLTIFDSHRSFEIVAAKKSIKSGEDLTEFLASIDFPNQGLIARRDNDPASEIIKDIDSMEALDRAIGALSGNSADIGVMIETDFRAHKSPSRRKNIEVAANKLAVRLSQFCPACQVPGFGMIRYEYGLHCTDCGQLNAGAVARELSCCVACDYREPGRVLASSLGPERCDWCNP